jgi:hypothetical protein
MHIIIIAVAILAALFFISQLYLSAARNLSGPVNTVKAKLTRKENHTSTRLDANGVMASYDLYRLVYTLETGGELNFDVSPKVYQNAPEDEWGTLRYQGKQFLGFEFRSEE